MKVREEEKKKEKKEKKKEKKEKECYNNSGHQNVLVALRLD